MKKGTKNSPKPRGYRLSFRGQAGCGVCDSSADFFTSVDGLNNDLTAQAGGVARIALLKNSATFTDVNDEEEWETKITAGDLRVLIGCLQTGELTDNATEEQLGSCEVNVISANSWAITFTDIEDNVSKDRFNFWKKVRENQNCYSVAMIYCNGDIMDFTPASVVPKYNAEGTKSGKRNWTVTITFEVLPDYITLNWSVLYPAIQALVQ